MTTLVERILTRVEALNTNPSRVSDEAGLSRSAVRDIVSGKSASPSIATLEALCGPLNCSISYLIGVADEDDGIPAIGKFWMVHGINQRAPACRHWSFASASDEAKRLAAAHPGVTFVVLEAMAAFQAAAPKIQTIEVIEDFDGDIPF